MDCIDPPVGATRLGGKHSPGSGLKLKSIPKLTVSVPNPSPTHQPFLSSGMTSPTLSTIPQLLLSSVILNSGLPGGSTLPSSPKGKTEQTTSLLSSKDSLSLPIMTNNFKRFVSVVGPVFWLQDRIEEIVLWKRGALRTSIWIAAYTLLCFYPRLLFLLPHLVIIGTILATYPYYSNPTTIDLLYAPDSHPSPPPVETVAPWQANIQAIQNLMGAYADFYSIVEPYTRHLCLTPAHFSSATRQFPIHATSSSSTSASPPTTTSFSESRSPYTTHILAVLVLSFFPLLFIVHLPWFPVRTLCILAGWIPILFTHPYTQAVVPVLQPILTKKLLLLRYFKIKPSSRCYPFSPQDGGSFSTTPKPITMIIQRFIDDDRLTDECWNSEMREAELWENERYNGPTLPPLVADGSSSSIATAMRKGWGKQHLKSSGERGPWTRSRDGSNDVSAVGTGSGVEASGEVSSNLTFALSPGWSFVESEDWRKDLRPTWSGCGCDEDGWVYTNDAWLGPRPAPYTSEGGSVTRRRRWVRRVWYSHKKAEADS